MQVRCKYCNSFISETLETCPNCGAPNENLKRLGNGVPTTIEELQLWYQEHNLPPEDVTRFFIGKDIRAARAFGIYKDNHTGNFVVYKNKSDGTRSIRYEGKDEQYAVNELYLRLKEEIQNQKMRIHSQSYQYNKRGVRRRHSTVKSVLIFYGLFILFMFFALRATYNSGSCYEAGYYKYEDTYYYYDSRSDSFFINTDKDNNTWEYYEGYSNAPSEIELNKRKNFISYENTTGDSIPDTINFRESGYFFDNCPNGYHPDNGKYYYFYEGIWYEYNNRYNDWDKIYSSNLNNVNKEIRLNCFYADDYNNNWNITDFRNSSYYTPDRGYYYINGFYYYYFNSNWYYYDGSSWVQTKRPNDYFNYYTSYSYDYDYDATDFEDSSYYQEYERQRSSSSSSSSSSYDSDWDSGSSWDSGDSWDSGSTDWDSDW